MNNALFTSQTGSLVQSAVWQTGWPVGQMCFLGGGQDD